ncbi:KPN_02809 family neutral zinc metallopeptidase [Brevibacterium samyangense]
MTFDPNARLDASQVSTRRGGGGGGFRRPGVTIGGGLGGMAVMIVLALIFGPQVLTGGGALSFDDYLQVEDEYSGGAGGDTDLAATCRTGADANAHVECRAVGTVNALNAYWPDGAAALGVDYRMPSVVLTGGTWQTACGQGTSAMGPFYCSADETVYLDVTFFEQLRAVYGADEGALPEEYVLAHEFGHHIQHLTGAMQYVRPGDTGPQSSGVRLELQADCYAGVWAANAAVTPDPRSGEPFLEPLTQEDISDALSAAEVIGDDHIQEMSGGRVMPESFTHGSSEQRQTWFLTGYRSGDPSSCDTFSPARV